MHVCGCFQTDLVGEPEVASLVQRLRVSILSHSSFACTCYLLLLDNFLFTLSMST